LTKILINNFCSYLEHNDSRHREKKREEEERRESERERKRERKNEKANIFETTCHS